MGRERLRWPDHEGHLGRQAGPERLTPYKPKYDHEAIDRLLDTQAKGVSSSGNGFVFIAEFIGTLAVGAQSPSVRAPFDLSLKDLCADLTIAGGSNTTIGFYKNGLQVVQFDIATSSTGTVETAAGIQFTKNVDRMQFIVLAVGSGSAELVCQARF